jgi:uncharacterized membrane protein YbhN (UPF0104 family)
VLLTIVIWCLNLAVFGTMFRMFSVTVPLGNVILLSIGMSAVQILPLKAFGNIGPHELVWIPLLSFSGLNLGAAISLAAATHLIYILYVSAFGAMLVVFRYLETRIDPKGMKPVKSVRM